MLLTLGTQQRKLVVLWGSGIVAQEEAFHSRNQSSVSSKLPDQLVSLAPHLPLQAVTKVAAAEESP